MGKPPQTTPARPPAFVEDQREFFNQLITEQWESYLNPLWDASRQFEVDRLFERVAPQRILDVGCGCGYHDLLMAEKPEVAEVVGIDYSDKSIEKAHAVYPHPKVRRYVADIFALPPPEAGFDLVVSFQVIEHVSDPQAFLRACLRQVRPGGWVAACTPNRQRLYNRFLRLLGKPPLREDPLHFGEYTQQELAQMGAAVGLQHCGSVSYGLSFVLPKLNWQLVPPSLSLPLGYCLPAVASRLCVIFHAIGCIGCLDRDASLRSEGQGRAVSF